MSLYKKVKESILLNKRIKASGQYLGIPYPYPRMNEYLSSIDRGQAIGILGATGTGKSKFTRYTFLYSVYKFYKETGYKTRILWFCLEDAKEDTYHFVICNYLKEQHNIIITHKELNSKSRELPDFVADKIEEAEEYFNEFEKIVTFIDGETEPTKLYDICKEIALNLGTVEKWTENIEGKEVKQYRYVSDTHVIAVFDNMSNIDTEDGTSNEQGAILKFVKEYMRLKLCNFFKWTCVMVMQLDFESEKQTFTKTGMSILGKIEPSVASIGDSKRSSRSFHLIFSLFDPSRYDLIHYPIPSKNDPDNCYRIDLLGQRFRALKVIKSNGTAAGMRMGLDFDAVSEIFTELPRPKTPELFQFYKSLTNKSIEKPKIVRTFDSIEEDEEAPF